MDERMKFSHWSAGVAESGTNRSRYVGKSKPAPALSRHPADLFRLIAGLIAFGLLALAARRAQPAALELDLNRLVHHLADAATLPLFILMQLGAVGAVAVAAGASFLARRYRLGLAILTGGALASLTTILFKWAVGGRHLEEVLSQLVLRGRLAAGAGFPSGHVDRKSVV